MERLSIYESVPRVYIAETTGLVKVGEIGMNRIQRMDAKCPPGKEMICETIQHVNECNSCVLSLRHANQENGPVFVDNKIRFELRLKQSLTDTVVEEGQTYGIMHNNKLVVIKVVCLETKKSQICVTDPSKVYDKGGKVMSYTQMNVLIDDSQSPVPEVPELAEEDQVMVNNVEDTLIEHAKKESLKEHKEELPYVPADGPSTKSFMKKLDEAWKKGWMQFMIEFELNNKKLEERHKQLKDYLEKEVKMMRKLKKQVANQQNKIENNKHTTNLLISKCDKNESSIESLKDTIAKVSVVIHNTKESVDKLKTQKIC